LLTHAAPRLSRHDPS